MWRKKTKFRRKFVVDHLQKVVYFVSSLKFWNAFCLIILIIANLVFHINDNPKSSASLPLYTFNGKNLQVNTGEINLPITNSFVEPSALCLDPPLNVKYSSLLRETGPPNNLEIPSNTANTILNGQNSNELSGISPVKNLDDPDASKPTSKKTKIILGFLAFISIIEHILPERFLKNIIKIVKIAKK